MARTPRIKSSGEGTAYYHLISRCSNRQFLFSAGVVRMWIAGMASRRKDAHEVMEIGSNEPVGYSSHGWWLADAQGRITGTSTTDRYGKTTYRDAQGRIQGSKK